MALPLSLVFGDWTLASSFRWSGKGFLYAPASGQSSPDYVRSQAKNRSEFFIPLSKRCRSRSERNSVVTASVTALLALIRPSAVVWEITLAVIDAFNRVANRGRSHVTKEHREVIAPLRAHLDTSSAVIAISGVTWGVASVLSGQPNTVLASAAPAVCCEASAAMFGAIERHFIIVPLGVA